MSISNHFFKLFLKSFFLFSYDGENYIKIDESKYSHLSTYGLGNLEGRAITTGCYDAAFYYSYDYYQNYDFDNSSGCFVKTEILDMTTMTWSDAVDYPYEK